MLRENARKEFEEARFENDPETINRLLVTGRDCVQQIKNKVGTSWNRCMRGIHRTNLLCCSFWRSVSASSRRRRRQQSRHSASGGVHCVTILDTSTLTSALMH